MQPNRRALLGRLAGGAGQRTEVAALARVCEKKSGERQGSRFTQSLTTLVEESDLSLTSTSTFSQYRRVEVCYI
eukprot:6195227-Pleurochrysis_carterae.AAC.4